MKKFTDWKVFGNVVATLVSLYTTTRDTLTPIGVGAEILPWILGDGKKFFTDTLKKLGEEFKKTQQVRVISKNVIEVNLGAPLTLPFVGVEVAKNTGGGWVRVERKKDVLYVDGKKVVLHLEEVQKDGKTMFGLDLSKALASLATLHPNILDALLEHTYLIPESLKVDEKGKKQFMFFWAVEFSGAGGGRCVRCLYWGGGQWRAGYFWLRSRFDVQGPALVCATLFISPHVLILEHAEFCILY